MQESNTSNFIIMADILIQTEKRLKVTESLELDRPLISIETVVINYNNKTLTPTVLFTGDSYSHARTLDEMPYKENWTLSDLTAHLTKWIQKNEINNTNTKI
jgi:hypothetical protein